MYGFLDSEGYNFQSKGMSQKTTSPFDILLNKSTPDFYMANLCFITSISLETVVSKTFA